MNEFIGCYKKRAKAGSGYKRRNERAFARFSWQRPISIGGDGNKQVIIGMADQLSVLSSQLIVKTAVYTPLTILQQSGNWGNIWSSIFGGKRPLFQHNILNEVIKLHFNGWQVTLEKITGNLQLATSLVYPVRFTRKTTRQRIPEQQLRLV